MLGILSDAFTTATRPSAGAHDAITRAALAAGQAIARVVEGIVERRARARTRARLAELDDRLLDDVGLTRADIADIARDAPAPWRARW